MARFGRFPESEIHAFLGRLVEVAPPPHARGKVKGPCRVYQGARTSDGYSNVWIAGRNIPGHVLMWELVTGRPPRQLLLHACDNRPCANFDHLSEGSALDNYEDMARKGRESQPPHPCGAAHPSAALDDAGLAEVERRLARGETQQQIADDLGVSQPLISAVANGKARTCSKGRKGQP